VPDEALVDVGYVARPHGLRGEVVVVLTTDRDERVAPGSQLFSDGRSLVVTSARGETTRSYRADQRRRWIVLFEGYGDRTSAAELRGVVLRATPIDDPDELWAHDVVGADVVLSGTGECMGRCVAVVANPAADLLELDSGALVPVVFVTRVELPGPGDEAPARVLIDPPPGLFDL
jgi:16S rRNA processing protein RimM